MHFTAIAQLGYTMCFVPLNLSSFLFFFISCLPSLSPSLFFVYCMTLLTPTFICLGVKKRLALFFHACCVVSDSFLSPPCVLCLLSHQWNIDESTEHVSKPHVCCWVVLQGRLISPLQFWGCCVCLWIMSCVSVCVFISVCAVLVIHSVWMLMKDHNPIITTARGVCLNDSCFFMFMYMCMYCNHKAWGLFANGLIFQHFTIRETCSNSWAFTQIWGTYCSKHAVLSSVTERTVQSEPECHYPGAMLTLIRLT